MALTPEEIALIQELKNKGMSLDQVKIELGKRRATTNYITTRPETPVQSGVVADTAGDLVQTVSGMAREYAGGVKRAGEAYSAAQRGEESPIIAGAEMASNVLGGMSRAFGEAVVGAGKILLPEQTEQGIKSSFERTIAPIAQEPWVQQAVQDYKWLEENDPVQFRRTQAALNAMEAVLDVAGLRIGTAAIAPAKRGMREATEELVAQTTKMAGRGVTPPPGAVTETARTAIGGAEAVATDVKEYAQRAAQHLQESMAEAQARRQAINQAASPQIQSAMKANVPTDQINLITTADNATIKAMQDMLYAYEGANQEAVAKLFSQSGEEMLKTVDNRMKSIGEELGKAIDNLPNATVDMRPAQQQVIKMLEDNGVLVVREPSGRVRYQWNVDGPSAYTPEQQAYIQQAVDTMLKFDQLNSRGVYNGDRFFGNLINQFYADPKLRGLFVNVNGVDQSFLPLMRELYRSPLDNITDGGISALNKQYSQYRRLVDAANETLYNAGKDLGIPIDIGAPLQTNLRRIFSNAKSRSQFAAVLKELDRVARENGYVGPDLKSMSKFDLYVQSLYPEEAIPRGSFAGQIRAGTGVGAWFERVMKAGEPNINDQRNAVKGLLNADIPRTPDVPPSGTAVPPTTTPKTPTGSQTGPSSSNVTPRTTEQVAKAAQEYQPEFEQAFKSFADDVGMEYDIGPAKSLERLNTKLNEEDIAGDVELIRDLNRGVVYLDSYDKAATKIAELMPAINKHFGPVTRAKFTLDTPGYNKILVNVKTKAGEGEIQFATREMWERKMGGGDILYGLARDEATPKNVAKKLTTRMDEFYMLGQDDALTATARGVNEGGVTRDVVRNVDYAGQNYLAVSPYPERTLILKGNATTKGIAQFLKKNFDLMQKEGYAVGGWFDKASGQTYLDVTVLVPLKRAKDAEKLAQMSNQKAIFRLSDFTEINTGGTGLADNIASLKDRQALVDNILTKKKKGGTK